MVMNVLSERVFAERDVPAEIRIVKPGAKAYGAAVDELGRLLQEGAEASAVFDAVDRVAASAIAALRFDAVLVPEPLDQRDPSDLVLDAFGLLIARLEARGLMTLARGLGPQGRTWVVISSNHLVWRAMHEPDDAARAALWAERWRLACEEQEERGGFGHRKAIIARYVAGDLPGQVILRREHSGVAAEMEAARGKEAPIMWRREVMERSRLPMG